MFDFILIKPTIVIKLKILKQAKIVKRIEIISLYSKKQKLYLVNPKVKNLGFVSIGGEFFIRDVVMN